MLVSNRLRLRPKPEVDETVPVRSHRGDRLKVRTGDKAGDLR